MSRTAMWLEFADEDDYLLPPPYNVLHYPISYVCKKVCNICNPDSPYLYGYFMRYCTLRNNPTLRLRIIDDASGDKWCELRQIDANRENRPVKNFARVMKNWNDLWIKARRNLSQLYFRFPFNLGLSFLVCKAQGKLGNIFVETFVILDVSSNVSMFAHPWKHCCGNKICFPRNYVSH
jgi:hypothetical protein